MNKDQLLQELSSKINTGEITKEELLQRFSISTNGQAGSMTDMQKRASFSMTKMLYVLGAVIVVVGVVFFVSQIWEDIGSVGRIVVTFGLGFIMAATGSWLLKTKPDENIGTAFHAIGGVLIPGGSMVVLTELIVDISTLWPITITFGTIFVFYLLLNAVHKNVILTFFAIANGTAFLYLLIEAMIDGPFYRHGDLYAYLTMVIGISYLLLAYAFREGWNKKLTGVLHFFGITGFLGAAFSQVFDSVPWQMVYFIILVGGLTLSVYMKSRSILIMSALFLIAHVSYVTGEYFADSLGWPISLILIGFVFIGLGYVSITINKKYIAN